MKGRRNAHIHKLHQFPYSRQCVPPSSRPAPVARRTRMIGRLWSFLLDCFYDPPRDNLSQVRELRHAGQLDTAFNICEGLPPSPELLSELFALAVLYEKRRNFSRAVDVYDHMSTLADDYKGARARRDRVSSLVQAGDLVAQPARAEDVAQIGRYAIERELGRGSMGVVYLARDPSIGRFVAIKTLTPSGEFGDAGPSEPHDRFRREASAAGRLRHPDIVTIYDVGEDCGVAYIAMEFVTGGTLLQWCTTRTLLPVPEVLSVVGRVALALDYSHGLNVVHRDIKPSNIMYDPATSILKVTDFGVARLMDISQTQTGVVLGTPSFMPPEQLLGDKVDGRSDLYSLGVVAFQLLTGVLPFRGETMAGLLYGITHDEAPDVRTLRDSLSSEVAHAVATALSKDPDARPQTGSQFARQLNGGH